MSDIDYLSMNHINRLNLNEIFTDNSNENYLINRDNNNNLIDNNNYIVNVNNEIYNNFYNSLTNILENSQTIRSNTTSVPEIREDLDEDEDRQIPKCSICLSNNVGIVFSCGHVCSCNTCSTRVSSCPICRQNIRSRQRLFF